MKKFYFFIKKHFDLFSEKNNITFFPIKNIFLKKYFLIKENKRYDALLFLFLRIKNGDILEDEYQKELLKALSYKVNLKDNKFFIKKYDRKFIFFKIRKTISNGKYDYVIHLFFQYNKPLFEELKNTFNNFEYDKNTESVTIPFNSEIFNKLLELPEFNKIELLIDLNGFNLYQKIY